MGALGYNASRHRGDGIERPHIKVLSINTVLLRLHNPAKKVGGQSGDFGEWLCTPFEFRCICHRFGVDGSALIVG